MKKNDLYSRNRQSHVAILQIIYKSVKTIFRQLIPLILIITLGGKGNSQLFIWVGIVLSIIVTIYSIIKYYRFYFFIYDNELIIHSGVFNKKRLNMPFDKIQSFNIEQNIVHKILDVVKVKIDTAGSSDTEIEFQAISRNTANELKECIFLNQQKTNFSKKDSNEVILSHNIFTLLKAGLAENHLKSGGLIILFFAWIWQNARDIGVEDHVEETILNTNYHNNLLLVLFLIFLTVSVLISLLRIVFTYYDLSFFRTENGFKICAGLFTTRSFTALDRKIQMISWADNPLKKLLQIKDLKIKQIENRAIRSKKMMTIPACRKSDISSVILSLYNENQINKTEFIPIDSSFFYRFAMYASILTLVLIFLFQYFGIGQYSYWSMLVLIWILINRFIAMKKKKYAYNADILIISGGVFGDKKSIIPMYKIQSVSCLSTPYQRRSNLCNLIVSSASGDLTIPYIEQKNANYLCELILYKGESSMKKWI